MPLFWGCFIALVATAFGFIVRAMIIGEWGAEFNLDSTQQGELFGAGLYPFAISIILFSLVIDRIGYKVAMVFGFVCHMVGTLVIILAQGYWSLYIGTFILALGNGTVEAYINPVVATIFSKGKTKWLSILHAGWPGGLVLAGIIALLVGDALGWRVKFGLVFIPTIIYFIMLIGKRFPVSERVAAGVSYRDMLKEVGALGIFIMFGLILAELGRVFGIWGTGASLMLAAIIAVGFGLFARGLGRPLFLLFLLLMIPLATTELGVDSWVTDLMTPVMGKYAGWLLVYTSAIMLVLRFMAGPIVHALSPLGLLAASAALAAVGLFILSGAQAGIVIFIAATIYGIGKTFFWPATLGVVAEQFPRGGALTLNGVAAVGMLGVGVIGTQFLGNLQDRASTKILQEQHGEVYEQVVGEERLSVFGRYRSVDGAKVAEMGDETRELVGEVRDSSKQRALRTIVVLPVGMLVVYLGLLLYFRSKGGYRAEVLAGHEAEDKKFAGGVEGPADP